jgi:hypothetical protein
MAGPPGLTATPALVHDEDDRLSAPGTLEAHEVEGGARYLLYPRMAWPVRTSASTVRTSA